MALPTMGKECGDNHATVAICRSLKDRKQGCCHASVASNRCHGGFSSLAVATSLSWEGFMAWLWVETFQLANVYQDDTAVYVGGRYLVVQSCLC